MKFVNLNKDDIVDSLDGVCVSLWCGGCSIKCENCHNAELWDPNNFEDADIDTLTKEILKAIPDHVLHNFSILGGEPFAEWNREGIAYIAKSVRKAFPTIRITCWTGYTLDQLKGFNDKNIDQILQNIDYLIDGPYIDSQRNTNLLLRGSENQRILKNENNKFIDITTDLEKMK